MFQIPTYEAAMVFRWGHSRSRASPFNLKKNREVFTRKPQTCLKSTGFKKREARECESVRAMERECDNEGEISFPRTLAISSLAFLKPVNFRHVWGLNVKTSRFYFQIKRRGSRSWVAATEHHKQLKYCRRTWKLYWDFINVMKVWVNKASISAHKIYQEKWLRFVYFCWVNVSFGFDWTKMPRLCISNI